jgi:1,4-dihydroxy-2-naphthoate octaprenyltransferase
MKFKLKSWLKASRIPSQLYIGLPLLAGQSYAFWYRGVFSLPRLILVQVYGIAIQLFIVYANDYADFGADLLNSTYTPFSGGSRVLVDGDLSRSKLGLAGLVMAIMSVGIAGILALISESPLILYLGVAAVMLLFLYSYPPFRVNYRGGGELLQMVGTGIVLPMVGWQVQAGTLHGFPYQYAIFILPTMLACAIGTSLPDELADIAASKRSASALLGQKPAQRLIFILQVFSLIGIFVIVPATDLLQRLAIVALPALILAFQCLCYVAKPGTRKMLIFVLFNVLVTLSIMLLSAIVHYI